MQQEQDGNEWEVFVVLEDNLPETINADTVSAGCAPTPTAITKR
jgi:hypothetical protein